MTGDSWDSNDYITFKNNDAAPNSFFDLALSWNGTRADRPSRPFIYNTTLCSGITTKYHYAHDFLYNYSSVSADIVDFPNIGSTQDVTLFVINYTRDHDAADQPFDSKDDSNTIVQEFTWDCTTAGGNEFCVRNGVSLVDTGVVSSANSVYNYSVTYDQNIEYNNITIWNGSDEINFFNQQYRNSVDLGRITIESGSGATSFN